jgi:hypothetical protein
MRRNVRFDLGLQGRGEHPPGRSPSRAISSRPAARLLAHLAIVPVETRARTGQESDPTPRVGQRVIGDDPELLERVDPGGTDGAQMIRDNPRVPWALRDLCNPWTWAYSAFRDPDGNAFSITEAA